LKSLRNWIANVDTKVGQYRYFYYIDRLRQLAEKGEEHVSSEHANWFYVKEKSLKINRC
jgi:hypothetical protein